MYSWYIPATTLIKGKGYILPNKFGKRKYFGNNGIQFYNEENWYVYKK
jgi:hypothetical protein